MPERAGRPVPRAGLRPVWRVAVVWVVTACTLLVLAWLLPGLTIDGFAPALAAAAVMGLLNALVWPLLVRLALPLTVLTLGLLPLALNAALVGAMAWLLPGVTLDGFWWGVAVSVGLTVITMSVTALLALDDDDVVLRQLMRRTADREVTSGDAPPGVVFLQIDGLAHDVLRRAVRDGNVPTLAGWLDRGSHHLTGWVTDWSSQTGASQAGILLGSNDDMPAFRWLEKESGRLFVSNRPRHAAEIERRHSTGRGLLHADGASRGNIFSGDAADAVLTMSSAGRRHGRIGAGYYAYYSHPYTTMRTLIGTILDVARELHQAALQRRRDVRPRVHRGGVYPLLRSFTTVVTRDVIIATLIGDMRAGRSVVYADFVGYDEVAHHSGVERYDALETLRRLDREFARLERAGAQTARRYELVLLSDHGQSQGATFRTRYGETLDAVVQRAVGRPGSREAAQETSAAGEESWGYAGGALEEIATGPGMTGRAAARAAGRRREPGGDVRLGPDRERTGHEAVVLASGNLALVHLTHDTTRMTDERIDELYPDLLPTLRTHPGVGFLLYPATLPAPEGELFGAEAVHRQLRRWLAHLGHSAYDDPAPAGDVPPVPYARDGRSEEAPMVNAPSRTETAGGPPC